MVFIGIDIGTSAVKLALVDAAQRLLGGSEVALNPSQPRPHWSEDDPDAWWAAVLDGMDRLARDHGRDMAGVRAIGLSGQMHGAVLLDAADRPVRPAILWNDGRSAAEAAALARLGDGLQEEVGVLAMPGLTGPKLAWLRRHEPDALARTRHLLLPKDTVRLRLTGERATDVSDASGTWLFYQAARSWSRRAIEACEVEPGWLPRLVESREPTGALRADLARRWGLPDGVVVAGGAGDVAAGGVGIGAVEAGRGFLSLGTSAQVFVAAERHEPDPARMVHAFCHAVPDRWFRMAALLNGASPLAAAARWTGRTDIAALLAEVEAGYRGPSDLLALPYLFGERTPHNDPFARGAVIGLSGTTGPVHIVQAVMEAVAFSLADGFGVLGLRASPATRLGFIGGGARSAFWGRLIASVLDVTLVRYDDADRGPAFGAARLARLCVTGEPVAAVATEPAARADIAPDPALHAAYAPRLAAFRALYRALRPFTAEPGPG